MERKIILSLEYGVKTIYAKAIEYATHSAYGVDDIRISLIVENISENVLLQDKKIKILESISGDSFVINIPRYEEFTRIVESLSLQGMNIKNIAGNDKIFVTVIGKKDVFKKENVLFRNIIFSDKEKERIGYEIGVRDLPEDIRMMKKNNIFLEHIYEY